jgi:AcrR family transcriptional regulator
VYKENAMTESGGRGADTVAQSRRSQIIDAAGRVFAAKGYHRATTRQIAEAAGVAEGTLYNYFRGKRDILMAIAREAAVPMERAIAEMEGLTNRDSLVSLFEKAFDIPESQLSFGLTFLSQVWVGDRALQQMAVARMAKVHERLSGFIEERMADGTLRRTDPEFVAQAMMGLFGVLLVPVLIRAVPIPGAVERRRMAEMAVSLLMDGIADGSRGEVVKEWGD